ncbi:uncharacterized protein MONBRDRAFT_38989 [Monosiga brevicollis MX1]|uniref:WD repeat-containing protein 92 n=1 Tax=Monosiga brevicollis TaxID=81824 RepID=A9VBF2_MONBE|nr:uncharacterized protein MONBRDRAFT_38989 [Monosiga brevicollis MX1]EDQ85227.1 predicted protein [Monosiga brevicollis MX1]|eukprot:XP_001750052.1 hypothetical protein [Monosiga brevicollis MX1]
MEKPQIIEHVNHSVNYTLFGARWVPASARCVLFGQHARNTGALQVMALKDSKLELEAEVTRPHGIKCGTFKASSFEERHLAVGDFDGELSLWDLERLDNPVYSAKQHDGMIYCIDGAGGLNQGGAPEIATGGKDGCVKIWDTRQPEVPVVDLAPEDSETARDCWSVAFGHSFDEERCVAAGYDNGDLKLFDLRAMKLRWETTLPNGICSLQFDRPDISMNKLLVSGLESTFNVFDMRTFNEKAGGYAAVTEKSHKATIWVGEHSPHDRDVFVTGGGNGAVNLWKYNYPKKRVEEDEDGQPRGVAGTVQFVNSSVVSTQPVASFDWSSDMRGLAICTSFDQAARVLYVTNLNLI